MKKLLAILLALTLLMAMGTASAEEPVKLTWWLFTTGDAPVDWPEVEAKLNEISAKEIGVTCEYKWMTGDQINMATQSGEYFDLAFTCTWYNDYATNVANGMFLNIADLLDEYGQDMIKLMPENIWGGVKNGDAIYGVPHMKDYGKEIFWILDTDFFVDELGMDPTTYESQHIGFEEMGEYMAKYVEMHPGEVPMKLDKSGVTCWENCLADWVSLEYWIGLDWAAKGTDQELVVKSALDIPAFIQRITTIHDWYEKGYINTDAAVTESMPRSIAGVVQSGQGWFGAETVWANAKQKECFISRFEGPYLDTDSLICATAVSSYSNYPVEAIKLVNLMNSNEEYRTIARYGIEGKHYEVVEPGIVRRTDLGNTNMSLAAYTQGSYALGPVEASAFESVPANPNQWTELAERYEAEAITSSILGFMFNIEPVADQCLAMKNVWAQYIYEMQTGTSDPAVVVPELKAELEAVGLNEVLAEAQAQLDAYMATK